MLENKRICEAPYHVEGCDGIGSTKDHFTPKSIAKEMGWKKWHMEHPDNIQRLSEACHREKDKTTEKRLWLLRRQLAGEYIKLGQHQEEMGR